MAAIVELSKRLRDIIEPENIAAYYNAREEPNEPYVGETFFPPTKQVGREIKTIKGRAGAPVALRASAFDANAKVRDRIPLKTIKNEMPFFREAMKINEDLRQQLLMAMSAGDQYVNQLLERVYDDPYHLVLGANAATERMRMQLLYAGTIDILDEKDNVPITADYGFDMATQMFTPTGNAAWDQPETAKPLEDIRAAMEAVHLDAAIGILTPDTLNKLLACKSVIGAMFTPATTPTFIPRETLIKYIETQLRVRIIVLSSRQNTYLTSDGEKHKFFPDGVLTLLPEGVAMGSTRYGTTPEEADLMADPTAKVSIVNTGVAITGITIPHPVNQETIVSQVVLPSFERVDEMAIINAYSAA